jgi:type 1 glutamine amidotransferase
VNKALIVWGGWDGHQPKEVGELCADILRGEGFEVMLSHDLSVLTEQDLNSYSLLVPIWTMGEISHDQVVAVAKAVEKGLGVGGCHGGMCDAFRNSPEWHFITGAQWVAHPGDDGVEYDVHITDPSHPITAGLSDFKVKSEQYYLHTDPANKVLATTKFPVADGPHVPNGECHIPVVFTRLYGKGKVFYCSLGHQAATIASGEPYEIMKRGLVWAARS